MLGPDVKTSHTRLFSLPVVPMLLGFDPRYQFIHEDDVVGALEHTVMNDLPGVYNAGADGVLALTEVVGLLGKTYVPALPPIGTGMAAALARRLGLVIPPEMLGQLRFGRGVDNRKLKATGFIYRYTTREAVIRLGEHMRLHPILRDAAEPYRYEEEVEEFLRWSPNVRDPSFRRAVGPHTTAQLQRAITPRASSLGGPAYTDLHEEEIIALIESLEPDQLQELREHERGGDSRERVLSAIDVALARRAGAAR